VDELIELGLARERRAREEDARKAAKLRRTAGLHKPNRSPKDKSAPSSAKRDTGVECAREGCREIVARIVVSNGPPYYHSRICAGLGGGTKGTEDAEPDVSDAELRRIGA
jgi:hypothetical protein